ncbi:MAG: hypothetical protein WC479_11685 [Candidatus Izemoplasmatales bacterium]
MNQETKPIDPLVGIVADWLYTNGYRDGQWLGEAYDLLQALSEHGVVRLDPDQHGLQAGEALSRDYKQGFVDSREEHKEAGFRRVSPLIGKEG